MEQAVLANQTQGGSIHDPQHRHNGPLRSLSLWYLLLDHSTSLRTEYNLFFVISVLWDIATFGRMCTTYEKQEDTFTFSVFLFTYEPSLSSLFSLDLF